MRRLVPWVLLLAACDFGFKPETLVDDLRVLSISPEPPELHPGDTANLSALVLDPKFDPATTLWLACAPDPFNQNRSPCASQAILEDPSQLGSADMLPPGLSFIGVGNQAQYATDPHLFDPVPLDAGVRETGTVGSMILISVADTVPLPPSQEDLKRLFDEVSNQKVASLITLFRVRISENPQLNHNPVLGRLMVAEELVPKGAHFQVVPHFSAHVDLTSQDSDYETYTEVTPTGTQQKTEGLVVAWYSTSGRFDTDRVALRTDVKSVFTAPGSGDKHDPLPDHPEQTLWAVVRDTRGGQVFGSFPFFICDPTLAQPVPVNVSSPATRADPVVITGQNLAQVLDVVVDDVALQSGAYSPMTDSWRGFIPAELASGSRWTIKVLGKDGSRVDYPLTVQVP